MRASRLLSILMLLQTRGRMTAQPMIAEAVWNEMAIKIRYRRYAGPVSRTVFPLGLVLKGGVWYLVARVGDQPRTYRVSNIVELTVTSERFERPKDFDLAAFWAKASRAYEVGLYRGMARLRISPRAMMQLDLLGSAVAQAAAETASSPDVNGWVNVVIPIETIDQTSADLMRLGTDAEVVEPLELRRRIAQTARRLADLYSE